MAAMCASRHEDFVSNGAVSPHVCDPLVVPYYWAVLGRGNPSGPAGDACLDTAAHARWAERAVDGGVVAVPQAFYVSPSAPPIIAQRVTRFDYHRTRNSLPLKKLRRAIQ